MTPRRIRPNPNRRRFLVWLAKRLAAGVLVLFFVTIVVFGATQGLPGNAAAIIIGRLGQNPNSAAAHALRHQLGLDQPLLSQYLHWIGGVVHGNLGKSLANNEPVAVLLGDRIVNSGILVGLTALVSVPLGFLAGLLAGTRRDSGFDRAVLGVSLGLIALPEFVTGLLLVLLFSTSALHILPAVALFQPGEDPLTHISQLVLPVATLSMTVLPYIFRLVRSSVIEVLDAPYVEMAQLKGMPNAVIFRRHVLRNAMVPGIQGAALSLAYLTGGVVVVEYLFNYPGLGTALTSAISARDLPTIQAVVLIFATAYVVFFIIADLLTVRVTPRLRRGPA